jgi:hypothetical protein
MVEFVCWVAVIALASAFFLSLMVKWGWMEYLQVHAPNAFFEKLLNCKFCCSFWMALFISIILFLATGKELILVAPICTTIITRELW